MRVELITQAEYARRRGCAKSAVAKAVAEGRITLIDGKIDPAVADVQWARNTRPRAGAGGPATGSTEAAPVSIAPPAPAALPADDRGDPPGALDDDVDDAMDYQEAARRLKVEEARLARMDRLERERRLTDAEAVGRAIWTAFRTLRDTAMPLGRRVAGRVASMTDAREIQLLIDEEQRACLNAFRTRILAPVLAEHASPSMQSEPDDVAEA